MVDVFFGGGRKVNARIKGFTVLTDQGIQSGGEGSAPEPFTLFLASLATCAGVYVQSFCQQRDISTEEITLKMYWDWDAVNKMIASIQIDINVPADFPEKYDNAVINAASLCAVKRHMKESIGSEIRIIRTKLN